MRILVTGGNGFIGSHTVAALVRAGHQVRLLVRNPDQVARSLTPHDVEVDDVVVGDVLDADAVRGALDGVDAVIHAAAVYSLNPKHAGRIRRTNVSATRLVLGAAAELGLDPIVHVSSTVTLVRRGGSGPELPLGDIALPYTQSKIDSEIVARELQESGAPVTIVYPGATLGPLDPYCGDQTERLHAIVRGLMPMWPRGGMHMTDVRDVASVLAAAVEPGREARRLVVPGHHVDAATLYGAARAATGQRIPVMTPPLSVMRMATAAAGQLNRILPDRWHYPADREGIEIVCRDCRVDDSPARLQLGVVPRPFGETVAETVSSSVETGRLARRYVR